MLLEILKESYKKTLTEPRLSGKYLSEKFEKDICDKIDSVNNIDEFAELLKSDLGRTDDNVERHIIKRIIAWENEPEMKK